MPIGKDEVIAILKKKFGFSLVKKTKHDGVELLVSGERVVYTQFSRSWDTIDDSMLKCIAHEVGVSLHDFKRMCGCTRSRDWYLAHLSQPGHA